MKDLDIMELCKLLELLVRYKHQMLLSQNDNFETGCGADAELDNAIESISAAMDVVMDDIHYHSEG